MAPPVRFLPPTRLLFPWVARILRFGIPRIQMWRAFECPLHPTEGTERAITDLLWYCLFWKGDEQSDGARIKQLLKSIDPKLSLTPDAEKVRVVCRPNSR